MFPNVDWLPSLVFPEQFKHTINDFILHFVQFTKHLFQDFLMTHKQTGKWSHIKTHTSHPKVCSYYSVSLPVSFCRGLTSLCHCHPPQAVPCIIKIFLCYSLLLFCFTDISRELCCFQLSPWNHRPVCRVSSVPRLLCTI